MYQASWGVVYISPERLKKKKSKKKKTELALMLLHTFIYDAHLPQLRNGHIAVKLCIVNLVCHLRLSTNDSLEAERCLCMSLQVADCFLLKYALQQ